MVKCWRLRDRNLSPNIINKNDVVIGSWEMVLQGVVLVILRGVIKIIGACRTYFIFFVVVVFDAAAVVRNIWYGMLWYICKWNEIPFFSSFLRNLCHRLVSQKLIIFQQQKFRFFFLRILFSISLHYVILSSNNNIFTAIFINNL